MLCAGDLLLNNIEVLSPVTIHANVCDSHGKPENVIITSNRNTLFVKQQLFRPVNCPFAFQDAQNKFLEAVKTFAPNDKQFITSINDAV